MTAATRCLCTQHVLCAHPHVRQKKKRRLDRGPARLQTHRKSLVWVGVLMHCAHQSIARCTRHCAISTLSLYIYIYIIYVYIYLYFFIYTNFKITPVEIRKGMTPRCGSRSGLELRYVPFIWTSGASSSITPIARTSRAQAELRRIWCQKSR